MVIGLAIDKVLIVDLWGDWAHYRKIYTTTSSLTYPLPTRTALAGMFAAIMGLEKESYYDLFANGNSAFALRILNPIKTLQLNFNLTRTKLWRTITISDDFTGMSLAELRHHLALDSSEGQRSQIPMEFLKDPKWRIYLWFEEKQRYDELKTLLKEHRSFFTPYLGISELIANFQYIGEEGVSVKEVQENNPVKIHSVIKKSMDISIKVEKDLKYGHVKIPGQMGANRVIQEFIELFYEQTGKPITITHGTYYTIGEETNVIFF
ncbi:MAG: type I-B CRISPR-associated protein Cas5 [Candidatus Heimdallarchaeota archaeon]|nr:type I-B CRISPR-associated protein Cas5 [Candidatus Heimdallarchaeota archaeon]